MFTHKISFPFKLAERILSYCTTEECSINDLICKAIDEWLKGKGY